MVTEKIFISYSRVDGGDYASRLSRDLKTQGYDVWIDQEGIRAGAEWDLEIEKALKASDCVLFIETEKSVSSNNVLDEVYYALEQQKKVIPLIFVDGKTPFRLQRLQHIDFTKDYAAGPALLVNELTQRDHVVAALPQETQLSNAINKPWLTRYATPIIIVTCLLVIVSAMMFFRTNKEDELPKNKTAELLDVNKFSGDWRLLDVEPKAKSTNGYLKIEALDGNKVSIKSYMQFYYVTTNDTSFLTVFNAFAGCTACVLNKDIKLTVEDVSIGSRTIRTAEKDPAPGGKFGDTLMDAGSTKSIRANATLRVIDNENIVIQIQHSVATTLAHNLVLQPFVYRFSFKKSD